MEALQVIYDPERVRYAELLEVFAAVHDPTAPAFSRQYASAVFPGDPEQRERAEIFLRELEEELGRTIRTEVIFDATFYVAEDYHQKFYLQREEGVWRELEEIHGSFWDAVDAREAARLNGYLGGFGSRAELESELPHFGLSPGAVDSLLRAFDARPGRPAR